MKYKVSCLLRTLAVIFLLTFIRCSVGASQAEVDVLTWPEVKVLYQPYDPFIDSLFTNISEYTITDLRSVGYNQVNYSEILILGNELLHTVKILDVGELKNDDFFDLKFWKEVPVYIESRVQNGVRYRRMANAETPPKWFKINSLWHKEFSRIRRFGIVNAVELPIVEYSSAADIARLTLDVSMMYQGDEATSIIEYNITNGLIYTKEDYLNSSRVLSQVINENVLDASSFPFISDNDLMARPVRDRVKNTVVGIGVGFEKIEDKFIITRVIADLAAEASGIRSNDEIIAVNNQRLTSLGLADVANLIRGEVDSSVVILIKRGGELLKVECHRTPVEFPK